MTIVSPAVVAESKTFIRETYDVSVDDTVYVNVKHVYKEKPEARDAVLMVHGVWHTNFFYDLDDNSKYSLQEYLAKNKFDTYALDLRGSGSSYKSDYAWYSQITLEDYVDDVEAVVEDIQEKGYEEIFLIGHSMGGMIATMYAASHSDNLKGLILIGTPFQELGLDEELLGQLRAAAENYPVIPCDPALVEPLFFAEEMVRDKVLEDATAIITQEVIGSTAGLQVIDLIFAEKVSDVTVPTLVLKGELDAIATNQDSLDLFLELSSEDKSFLVIGGHGHDILLEKKPKKVYKEISQWLKAHS